MDSKPQDRTEEVARQASQYVIDGDRKLPIELVRGEGSYVWDRSGRRYLDWYPGSGSQLLGHCPPQVIKATEHQLGELLQGGNRYLSEPQGRLAAMLVERSFDGQAFFCHSGSEANETAIKLARRHGAPDKYKIISFQGSFHGDTVAATTASGQPHLHAELGPLVAGFIYAPWGDLEATESLVDDETCAILVEPVQGRAGVQLPPDDFLPGLRAIADRHQLLVIFDESETGCGRTGQWFAYQHTGVTPDVMTLADSLGGGLACGAVLANRSCAPSLPAHLHDSTLGGNPVSTRAAIAMLETIEDHQLLEKAQQTSALFQQRLGQMREDFELIRDVRMLGLMIGIQFNLEVHEVVQQCRQHGLLVHGINETVLCLLPPLITTEQQVHEGCDVLVDVLQRVGDLSAA